MKTASTITNQMYNSSPRKSSSIIKKAYYRPNIYEESKALYVAFNKSLIYALEDTNNNLNHSHIICKLRSNHLHSLLMKSLAGSL